MYATWAYSRRPFGRSPCSQRPVNVARAKPFAALPWSSRTPFWRAHAIRDVCQHVPMTRQGRAPTPQHLAGQFAPHPFDQRRLCQEPGAVLPNHRRASAVAPDDKRIAKGRRPSDVHVVGGSLDVDDPRPRRGHDASFVLAIDDGDGGRSGPGHAGTRHGWPSARRARARGTPASVGTHGPAIRRRRSARLARTAPGTPPPCRAPGSAGRNAHAPRGAGSSPRADSGASTSLSW